MASKYSDLPISCGVFIGLISFQDTCEIVIILKVFSLGLEPPAAITVALTEDVGVQKKIFLEQDIPASTSVGLFNSNHTYVHFPRCTDLVDLTYVMYGSEVGDGDDIHGSA